MILANGHFAEISFTNFTLLRSLYVFSKFPFALNVKSFKFNLNKQFDFKSKPFIEYQIEFGKFNFSNFNPHLPSTITLALWPLYCPTESDPTVMITDC